MVDNLIDHFTELGIELGRVVSMYASGQVRALADMSLIRWTPLDPLMILVTGFHWLHVGRVLSRGVSALLEQCPWNYGRRSSTALPNLTDAFIAPAPGPTDLQTRFSFHHGGWAEAGWMKENRFCVQDNKPIRKMTKLCFIVPTNTDELSFDWFDTR